MYLCVRGINFASFYDFSIGFRQCGIVFHFIASHHSKFRGRDRMLVGLTTTCAVRIRPRRGVLDSTFCDKVCQ